jgi:hypothetical protein
MGLYPMCKDYNNGCSSRIDRASSLYAGYAVEAMKYTTNALEIMYVSNKTSD